MRRLSVGLLSAATLMACQLTDSDEGTEDAASCAGKCDGVGGATGSLPVVPRGSTWDGGIVFTADGADGCRAVAVRPGHIQEQGTQVGFAPAAFSAGVTCPSAMGDLAVTATPGFDQNPFPSDAEGNPQVGGSHLAYQLTLLASDDGDLTGRRALAVVRGPGQDDAEVTRLEWIGDAQPLGIAGRSPTATADGRLLVFEAADGLRYARNVGGQWSSPAPISSLFADGNADADGLTVAERFPLAARQLRTAAGTTVAAGTPVAGTTPWISQDGTELFYETPAGALMVVGQGTNHAMRHIDGAINPARNPESTRTHLVGLGRSRGIYEAYQGRLPAQDWAPAYPLLGAAEGEDGSFGTYHEVDFAVAADRDYLLYLPMNENVDASGNYDLGRTPDLSGNFNTAVLEGGARFSVEETGEDENLGANGRAIYFAGNGRLRVPASGTLLNPGRGMTISMFVQRLDDVGGVPLLDWPGVARVGLAGNGSVEATVFTDAGTRTNGQTGAPLGVGDWVHVAVAYDAFRGDLAVVVDGTLVSRDQLGRGLVNMASGDLLVGPGAGGDEATVALDEVAISRVFRTPEELAIAATGVRPAGPPMGGVELLSDVEVPVGLDPDQFIVPAWTPNRSDVVELGMMLFFDPRLSANGEVSCATCHDPQFAWTDGRAVGLAIDGTDLDRATPTIFNRVMSTRQFWDGRSRSVEAQALSPIGSPREMNMPLNDAVAILSGIPEYVELFQSAFGRGPDISGMANAISAFERVQLAGASPVDRFEAGDTSALTAQQQRGRVLFHGKARCVSCHSGSNYSDEEFHNVGFIGGRDLGRFYSSGGRASMMRAFKTPTLRNAAVTGPYFHDGSVETLADVVALYNAGPSAAGADWESRPLGLTADEEADLVAFLEALTSPNAVQSFEVDLPGMD